MHSRSKWSLDRNLGSDVPSSLSQQIREIVSERITSGLIRSHASRSCAQPCGGGTPCTSAPCRPKTAESKTESEVSRCFLPSIAGVEQPANVYRHCTPSDASTDRGPSNRWPEALTRRVHVHHRVLTGVAIHARAVHQPQRVGLQIPPRRRVVVAHPVLVEAGFGLEPLAGEVRGGVGAGGDLDAAEGGVGGGDGRAGGGARWPTTPSAGRPDAAAGACAGAA